VKLSLNKIDLKMKALQLRPIGEGDQELEKSLDQKGLT
jgi:hypothetical protein